MRQATSLRRVRIWLALMSGLICAGCGTVGYYYQSAAGQMDLLSRREDIQSLLGNESLDADTRRKLEQVVEIRRFASEELGLPDNDSYTTYADLERPYVVWNVFAAPNLSTEPHQWCYPIIGCAVYRGYFDQESASEYARELELEEFDIYVAGVPAYSTLGWFDDPVLNTIIQYPEPRLAGLIFHELAHQLVYVKDDSVFNESFATAVEIAGSERWLKSRGREAEIERFRTERERDREVVALILSYRDRLQTLYESDAGDEAKLEEKSRLIAEMKLAYESLVQPWDGYRNHGRWMAQDLNNAHFVVIGAYYDRVGAFLAMLDEHDGDLPAFYQAVAALSKKPKEERDEILDTLDI